MLEEDRRLRQLGHPQSHIYMFRSADLTYDTIAQLPLPWYDIRGIIPDEYWSLLQDYGIPSSAFPSRLSQRSPSLTAREQELRTYASQASRSFTSHSLGSTQNLAPVAMHNINTFAARFGSPVRRINFAVPPTPSMSPARHSPSTDELMRRAANAIIPTPPQSGIVRSPGPDTFSARSTNFQSTQSPMLSISEHEPVSDTHYCDHIEFTMSAPAWHRIRTHLLETRKCSVLQAFAMNDKQFQTAMLSSKIPDSFALVGKREFNTDAWRDLKEWLESLDVWNFLCAVQAKNFRAILDSHESISIGGNEMARMLQLVPTFQFLGHSEFTSGITDWHAAHVLDSPALLCASLSSVVLRDRALRPVILQKINNDAKAFVRSTFVRNDGLFITYIAALHSWRYKEADVWTRLFKLNESLAGKKPRGIPLRDWRLK